MQDVARRVGVHVATVSRALNRRPGVSAAVRERVQAAAEELGYRMNPLVSALIRSRRDPRRGAFRATLGLLEPSWPPGRDVFRQDYRELIEGAQECASEMGYALESFRVHQPGVSPRRLAQILAARGIVGVLVPPVFSARDLVRRDFFAGPVIAIGFSQRIAVPRVAHDHSHGVRMALAACRAAGRRRIGLVLPRRVSEKVEHRWLAAFLAERELAGGAELLPPLLVDGSSSSLELARWFRAHRPDAILGLQHMAPLLTWRESAPARRGRPSLITLDRRGLSEEFPGVDHRLELMGRVAIEQLALMVERNDPEHLAGVGKIMIEGVWVGNLRGS